MNQKEFDNILVNARIAFRKGMIVGNFSVERPPDERLKPEASIFQQENEPCKLYLLAESKDPTCNGNFSAQVSFEKGGQIQRVLTYDQSNLPQSLDHEALGLPSGNFTVTISVTDCVDTVSFSYDYVVAEQIVDIFNLDNDSVVDCNFLANIFDSQNSDPLWYNQVKYFTQTSFVDAVIANFTPNFVEFDSNICKFKVASCDPVNRVEITLEPQLPPATVSLNYNSETKVLDLSFVVNESSCNGVFNATLRISTLTGQILVNNTYDNTDLPATFDVASLGLEVGQYTAVLFGEDCVIAVSDAVFFTIPDETSPTIISLTPGHNSSDIETDSDILIEFSEAILYDSGDIQLFEDDVLYYTYQPGDLQFLNSSKTLKLNNAVLQQGKTYKVVIPTGAITDSSGNDFSGIAQGEWTFTTVPAPVIDTDSPVIVSQTPSDQATGIPLNQVFSITFDEPIVLRSGSITLRKVSNNSLVSNLSDTNLSNGNKTLGLGAFSPINLEYDESYYISISSTIIEDTSGNVFGGIAAGDWTFTTALDPASGFSVVQDPTESHFITTINGDTYVGPDSRYAGRNVIDSLYENAPVVETMATNTNDHAQALRTAINNAKTSPQYQNEEIVKVLIPNGTYEINSYVGITDPRIIIAGESQEGTILDAANNDMGYYRGILDFQGDDGDHEGNGFTQFVNEGDKRLYLSNSDFIEGNYIIIQKRYEPGRLVGNHAKTAAGAEPMPIYAIQISKIQSKGSDGTGEYIELDRPMLFEVDHTKEHRNYATTFLKGNGIMNLTLTQSQQATTAANRPLAHVKNSAEFFVKNVTFLCPIGNYVKWNFVAHVKVLDSHHEDGWFRGSGGGRSYIGFSHGTDLYMANCTGKFGRHVSFARFTRASVIRLCTFEGMDLNFHNDFVGDNLFELNTINDNTQAVSKNDPPYRDIYDRMMTVIPTEETGANGTGIDNRVMIWANDFSGLSHGGGWRLGGLEKDLTFAYNRLQFRGTSWYNNPEHDGQQREEAIMFSVPSEDVKVVSNVIFIPDSEPDTYAVLKSGTAFNENANPDLHLIDNTFVNFPATHRIKDPIGGEEKGNVWLENQATVPGLPVAPTQSYYDYLNINFPLPPITDPEPPTSSLEPAPGMLAWHKFDPASTGVAVGQATSSIPDLSGNNRPIVGAGEQTQTGVKNQGNQFQAADANSGAWPTFSSGTGEMSIAFAMYHSGNTSQRNFYFGGSFNSIPLDKYSLGFRENGNESTVFFKVPFIDREVNATLYVLTFDSNGNGEVHRHICEPLAKWEVIAHNFQVEQMFQNRQYQHFRLNGDDIVYEHIIYDSQLTGASLQQTKDYLEAKFKLDPAPLNYATSGNLLWDADYESAANGQLFDETYTTRPGGWNRLSGMTRQDGIINNYTDADGLTKKGAIFPFTADQGGFNAGFNMSNCNPITQGLEEAVLTFGLLVTPNATRGAKVSPFLNSINTPPPNAPPNINEFYAGFMIREVFDEDFENANQVSMIMHIYAYYLGHGAQHFNLYDDNGVWVVPYNKHHEIALRMVMNTPGQSDGILQAWANQKLMASIGNLTFRDNVNVLMERMSHSVFFGGDTGDIWKPRQDGNIVMTSPKVYDHLPFTPIT